MFMRGVINLRGSVVPVVDLRLKFGLPATVDTADTCIVVLEVILDSEVTVVGAVADSVKEVFEMTPDQIEPAPRIGTRLKTDFILGMGKNEEQFIIILDIDKIFSADELSLVQEAGAVMSSEEEVNASVQDPASMVQRSADPMGTSDEPAKEPLETEPEDKEQGAQSE